MRRVAPLLSVVVIAFGVPRTAAAQDRARPRPAPTETPRELVADVSVEATCFRGQEGNPSSIGPTSVIGLLLEGRARPLPWLELHAVAGGSYVANEAGPLTAAHTTAGAANPYLGAAYVARFHGIALRGELGVAVPVQSSPTALTSLWDLGWLLAHDFARLGAYGARDLWLWSPSRVGMIATVAAEWRRPRDLLLEGGAALAVMTDGSSTRTTLQLEGAVGWATDRVDAGVRVRTVIVAGPEAWVAIEPFIATHVDALTATLTFTTNFGATESTFDGGAWGLHVRLGARWW